MRVGKRSSDYRPSELATYRVIRSYCVNPGEMIVLAHEIMVSPVITITPDTTLADAAELMLKHHIGGLPVVDDKK